MRRKTRHEIIVALLLATAMGSAFQLRAQASSSLIISEIMSDPAPPRQLPPYEYVELYNCSNDSVNIRSWKLSFNDNEITVNIDRFIAPHSFILLTRSTNAAEFVRFGETLGLNSMPALTNEQGTIILRSPSGQMVHIVSYSTDLHTNELKREGGWSLELIDESNPCLSSGNWSSSISDAGGTPGTKNSISQNSANLPATRVISAFMPDSTHLLLRFNNAIRMNAAVGSCFQTDLPSNTVLSAFISDPFNSLITLQFKDPVSPNEPFEVTLFNISDCSGRPITDGTTVVTGLATKAMEGTLIINEIMFNPTGTGKDYVEVFNRSKQIINLQDILICNRSVTGQLQNFASIIKEPKLLMPGAFAVLTEDSMQLIREFILPDTLRIVKVSDLPTLPDDSGIVIISNEQGDVIDEVQYNKDWHIALLSNDEGIALERIDPARSSSDPNNWTSASTLLRGTPGYQNSQFQIIQSNTTERFIKIDRPLLSPDGDGHEDILLMSYTFKSSRTIMSLRIFNASAQLVKTLLNNQLMAVSGQLLWDGSSDNNKKLPAGLYILQAIAYDESGKTTRYSCAITLTRRH